MQIDTGSRVIEIVQNSTNPVDEGLFEKFVLAVIRMQSDPGGTEILNQLPVSVKKIHVSQSGSAPMTYSEGADAYVTISDSYWLGKPPALFDFPFLETTIHEILHGSVAVNEATANFVMEVFADNPDLNGIFPDGPLDTSFIYVTEHLFVYAGAEILANKLEGHDVYPYKLRDPNSYFASQMIKLNGFQFRDLKAKVDKYAPEALPVLLQSETEDDPGNWMTASIKRWFGLT